MDDRDFPFEDMDDDELAMAAAEEAADERWELACNGLDSVPSGPYGRELRRREEADGPSF